MSAACPSERELFDFTELRLKESRALWIRQHAVECQHCSRRAQEDLELRAVLSAPLPASPSDDARVQRILRQVAQDTPRERRFQHVTVLASLAAVVLIAGTSALLLASRRESFSPRGGPVSGRARPLNEVELRFYALGGAAPRRLSSGSAVSPETAWMTTYRQPTLEESWLLAFAVDAKGDVHWIQPGFDDPEHPSNGTKLFKHITEVPLPESTVLESPAPGALRVFTLVSPRSVNVGEIETLRREELSAKALEQRFPGSLVRVVELFVVH